ncbi:MAG: arylsulfotransferase family protein [Gaiellaceae bacterium]
MRGICLSAVAMLGLLYGTADASRTERPLPLTQHFHSRPDLKPPGIHLAKRASGVSAGYIFIAPKLRVAQPGPEILDDNGQVVWFQPLAAKDVSDFRVQTYEGKPVLTWWRGRAPGGVGGGYYVIYDTTYRKIAQVKAGHGLIGDLHEFRITPRNTALITVYKRRPADLRPVGGPRAGKIFDGIVQEIDISTGRVLFEWHSWPRVGLKESYAKAPAGSDGAKARPYDYFHINSIELEPDGNLLVSARNTHTLYEIDRVTGKILWRLGGRRTDFRLGPGVGFAWQHDARRLPDGTISLFDNSATPPVSKFTRVLVLEVNETAKRVSLVRSLRHPKGLLVPFEGNAQFLPNGHVFVGWGATSFYSEFDAAGHLLLDGRIGRLGPPGTEADTYRAYRFEWRGEPTDLPAVVVEAANAYVSWNGATEVATWQLLGGQTREQLSVVASARKRTFETRLPMPGDPAYVAVRALGLDGRVLAMSKTLQR